MSETEKRRTGLLEELAELEHNQWRVWSMNLVNNEEKISPERMSRWMKNWVMYKELPEEEKMKDREWAEQVLLIVKRYMGIK